MEQENKGINGKLIGGIVAVIIVLAIGISIFALNGQSRETFKKLSGTPEEIVMGAISNTEKKFVQEQLEADSIVGNTQINDICSGEAREIDFELGIQGMSGIPNVGLINAYIKDTAISGNLKLNKDAEKVNGNVKLTQSGLTMAETTFYKDKDEIGFNVPKIFNNPYAVKLGTFLEDYNKSALRKMLEMPELTKEDMAEIQEVFVSLKKYTQGVNDLADNKEYTDKVNKIEKELVQSIGLKEDGEEQVVLSDGSKTTWKVYKGTITLKQLKGFLYDYMEAIMKLEFVQQYFDKISSIDGSTSAEGILKELEKTFEENTTYDDTVFDIQFLVDSEYLRGIKLNYADENDGKWALNIQLTGAKYICNGITASLNFEGYDEKGSMELVFNQNVGEKTSVFNQTLACSLKENDEVLGAINYEYDYDTKAKENNLNVLFDMNITTDGEKTSIKYTATGDKVVNKKEVSTNLTDATLTVNSGGEEIGIGFNMGYGIKAIKGSDIEIDKAGIKYIFEMSEKEIMTELQNIQSNVQAFTYGLL